MEKASKPILVYVAENRKTGGQTPKGFFIWPMPG